MNPVGAVSLGWSGKPLREVFEDIAKMGGRCVEINGNAARHHHIELTQANIPDILRQAEESDLTIGSVSGYCDFAQTDAAAVQTEIDRLLTSCEVASALGAPVVRAFVGDVKPGLDMEVVRPTIIAAFKEATERAGALGVTLGIENHGRLINDGPTLVAMIEDVGADNLGVTLDTGNFAWAGHGPDRVRADFEAVLPHVVNVHIKDGVWTDTDRGESPGFDFVPAGDGDLPLAWLLNTLVDHGYDGPVYSEYEGGGDFIAGTRESIAYLKRVLSKAT